LIPQFGSNAAKGCFSTTKTLFLVAVTCEELACGRCLQHVLCFFCQAKTCFRFKWTVQMDGEAEQIRLFACFPPLPVGPDSAKCFTV